MDHYGLEKAKHCFMEYLTVLLLLALFTQEVEVEQTKRQKITLQENIDEPAASTNEPDIQNENACMALIKAGEIPAPLESLFPYHSSRKA
jgi:hypothetical protein